MVNPGTVLGPIIPPAINASMLVLLRLLQGSTEEYLDFYMGPVHVKDVALAHILAFAATCIAWSHICLAKAQSVTIKTIEANKSSLKFLLKLHVGVAKMLDEASEASEPKSGRCKDMFHLLNFFPTAFTI